MIPKITLSEAVGSTVLRQSEASRKAAEPLSEAVGTRSRFPPIPPKGFRQRPGASSASILNSERRGA